jgi:iron(III) transport system substrate-binding protein
MHMVHLGRLGILDPLPAGVAALFPAGWRDPEGRYAAFGARARVFLVNTELLDDEADHPRSIEDLMNPKYHAMGFATSMAEPLTGTTYTHAVGLLTEDEEGAKVFFQAIAAHGEKGRMKIVKSNGQVMRAVRESENKVCFGLTDTDDAWVAIQKGFPVKVVYPDQHRNGAFIIPNTIALVKGRRHPEAAEKLLRWIVSEETEARLAAGPSAQVPLRTSVPVPEDGHVKLPGKDFKAQPVDWQAVGKNADRWRDWLTSVFKK